MVSDLSTTAPLHPMMGWRYSLTRCLGRTALADVYWARDLEVKDTDKPEAYVLLLKVATALNQLNGFEDALYDVLMPFTESRSALLPIVTDSGNDNGTLWLVMPHIEGKLFSEYLQGGKDRQRLLQDLKPYLNLLANSINQLEPPTYGFLEPAALQLHNAQVRLLNAPLVYALRHYIKKTTPAIDYRLTLNSGYISPAVAVGDVPQPEDDVFSLACMSYHFLTGEAPFKKQHTLEAVVRHTQPSEIKHLSTNAQEALQQGLALQPGVRQETAQLFIKQLTKRSPLKLVLPTAVAAAVAITGFATHHLMQQAETYIDHHANNAAKPVGIEPKPHNKVTEPVAVNAPKPTKIEPNLATAQVGATLTNTSQPLDPLGTLAHELTQQLNLGENANLEPIVGKLRDVLATQHNREQALPLLEQVLQYEHTQTQTLLTNKDLITANLTLSRAGQWIKEFSLSNQAIKQLELEKQLQTAQTQQLEIERLLARAQEALAAQRWTNVNGANNAALFLDQVLEKQPQHPEAKQLLLEAVRKQQDTILKQINNKTIQSTQSLLTDTAELLKKPELSTLAPNQTQLEQAYQALKTSEPDLVKPIETATTQTPSTAESSNSSALSAQDITAAIEQAANVSATTINVPSESTQIPPKTTAPQVVNTEPNKTVPIRKVESTPTPVPTGVASHTASPRATEKVERPAPTRPVLRQQQPSIKVELVNLPTRPTSAPVRRNPTPRATVATTREVIGLQRHQAERIYYPEAQVMNDYPEEPMRRAAPARPVPNEQPRRTANYRYPTQRPAQTAAQDNMDELMEVPLSSILE
ncbi:MAG: hypothetical protein RLZZ422_1520 [Pseudomonadota bacterium]|jgi:serine/threonine protein kinase